MTAELAARMLACARRPPVGAAPPQPDRSTWLEALHFGSRLGEYAAWHREHVGWPKNMERMIEVNERRRVLTIDEAMTEAQLAIVRGDR